MLIAVYVAPQQRYTLANASKIANRGGGGGSFRFAATVIYGTVRQRRNDRSATYGILATMPNSLSVVLITLNEAANLPRTLASVRWAGEILIVDSGSTDATVDLAREAGARVFQEPWRGFGPQKNAAISHATGDWILSLDADEEVSPALAAEIQALLAADPPFAAYRIPRLNHFLGRPLRHGGYWPDPKLRLFRRGAARFQDRAVHETLETSVPVGRLRNPLIHHCYPTLEDYIEHMNRYSTAGAAMLVSAGRAPRSLPALLWSAVLNPVATFIYNYIFRAGFLDGREGLLQHLNHSVYIHWKYAKAWRAGKSARSSPAA
jgi:glycosyltransferase involved in cell wall biosynthesis